MHLSSCAFLALIFPVICVAMLYDSFANILAPTFDFVTAKCFGPHQKGTNRDRMPPVYVVMPLEAWAWACPEAAWASAFSSPTLRFTRGRGYKSLYLYLYLSNPYPHRGIPLPLYLCWRYCKGFSLNIVQRKYSGDGKFCMRPLGPISGQNHFK
ncbi:hypothetical protein C8R44DRAFT_740486 [Mycena epipterygia]|nr:hypothetical protein C8R44DRAFT_740486 [Mycena epipterygia]